MTTIKILQTHLQVTTQITLTNPVFDPENIERLYTYSFTIALTPEVRKLFKHTNRLDSPDGKMRYDAELHIEGQLFEAGEIEILKNTDKVMTVGFKNKGIRIKERLAAVPLSDLSIPVAFTTPFAPTYNLTLTDTGDPDATAILVSINGEVYYGSTIAFPQFINLINQDFLNLASVGTGAANELVLILDTSQASISEILLRPPAFVLPSPGIYTYFDTVTSNSAAEVTRVNTDFDTHALSLEAGNDTHVFAPVYAPNLYDRKNPTFKKHLNTKTGNTYNTQSAIQDVPNWNYTWSPQTFLTAVLAAIETKLDIKITGILDTDADLKKLVIFSNRLIDFLAYPKHHIGDIEEAQGTNIPATTFDLADFLPALNCFELLEYLRTNFGLFYRFKDGEFDIQTRKSKLNITEKNWTKFFESAFAKEYKEGDAFTLEYERYSDETTRSGQLLDTDGGEDAKTYTAKFWTLFYAFREASYSVNNTWKISQFFKKGTSSPISTIEKQDPILLFYNGLQPDSAGVNYPFANHDNKNFDGTSINAYSLDWNGTAGRYEKFLKEIIALETKGQLVEMIGRIPLAEILELKRNWNAKIGIYSPDGKITAHITSISFLSNEKGIGLAKVKMIKV